MPNIGNPFVESYIEMIVSERGAAKNTVDAYLRDLSAFFAFLMVHTSAPVTLASLEGLKTTDFRSYLARRAAENRAKSSTARAVSVLRGFFRHLEREELGSNVVARSLRSPRLPRAVPRPLTPAQAGEVTRAAAVGAASASQALSTRASWKPSGTSGLPG